MGKGLRIPMFVKFLIGCLALAALLIIGGYFVVRAETRLKSRGYYLKKHYNRYAGYEHAAAGAVASVTDLIASDEALREALAARRAAAAPTPEAPTAPIAPTAPAAPTAAAAPRTEVGKLADRIFKQLSSDNGLRPDLMLVFTAQRELAWASREAPFTAEDMRTLEAVSVVVQGGAFFGEILVHAGTAWHAAGVPLRADDGSVIGGVIVGVSVERTMLAYKEASDDEDATQHRVTLLVEGRVIASPIPAKLWGKLAKSLDEGAWSIAVEGDDRQQVITFDGTVYEFHVDEEVSGFLDNRRGVIGKQFLMRTRSLRGQTATVPWTELGIGVVLSVLVASLLALWITRPIKQFVKQSRDLLQGDTDLTQRIIVNSRDETADLAENINQVFARLHSLATDVQAAAFQVGASSAEISAASKQMLGGLKDQTLKIEGSTAAVTELSASIQQVAGNAAQATDVAEKSNVAVGAAVSRMQQIRGSVEDAGEKMTELGESSKRIGNIVEVIRQISEQTSLLALNASIEAAHAGEQGRGFAVVADEVSSLARRVGQSAKDIEALIQTIKEQTAAAIASMEVGTREVENGTQLVTATLTDLGQLISVVKDTATAVQEQAVVSDEIARNMDAVQKIATEVLGGSEESVVQAEQLHELAFNLEQSVGGFNLDGTGVRRGPGGPRGKRGERTLSSRAPKALDTRSANGDGQG